MIQIRKIIEFFKSLSDNSNKKRMIENSIIIIIIGIIIIIAGSSLFGKGSDSTKAKSQGTENSGSVEVAGKTPVVPGGEIENELSAILSQIDGAGKVDVMITYISGKEVVPAYDTKRNENDTQEKDNGGGTRDISQGSYENNVAYEELQGGNKKPIILKELQPQVKGVVIVAEGASDPRVRENLSRAVQVLTDVPAHKIQVFERKK